MTYFHNLVLSVLAVICGADSFVAIALCGQLNEAWLHTCLALPHGIPSHDTLGRVFARLDAARFEEGFQDGVQAAFALTDGQVVPPASGQRLGPDGRGRPLQRDHGDPGATAHAVPSVSSRKYVDIMMQTRYGSPNPPA